MIKILHISDIHFPSEHWEITANELKKSIIELINNINDNNLFLLISGDITYRGKLDAYKEANNFFKTILSEIDINIDPRRILLCPGNHDIINRNSFQAFDEFSYGLRKDEKFLYSNGQTQSTITIDDTLFLGINSVYHYDHRFGLVNTNKLGETLSEANTEGVSHKIAFTHHHLINQFENDTSAIRNAASLIELLDYYDFEVIFHGHQHTNTNIVLGESQMRVLGVNTTALQMEGYINGVNYYEIDERNFNTTRYVYSRDNKKDGIFGVFKKLEI